MMMIMMLMLAALRKLHMLQAKRKLGKVILMRVKMRVSVFQLQEEDMEGYREIGKRYTVRTIDYCLIP